MRLLSAVLLLLLVDSGSANQGSTVEKNVHALLARMTLKEKISMLGGSQGFYLSGFPRLGIPAVKMADGPMGVVASGKATAFPASICMAATFNEQLIRQVGGAIGRECRGKGVGILLAPGVNIYRIPQNGRNFEYYGEDPFLASRLAVSFIQGVQNQGVMATVKHFAGNNLEYDRHRTSSEIDERTLREIYLPVFRAAVQEGKCGAVMTAYNSLNSVHCSENAHLIREILKGEWGFTGFVMSDWISVYSGKAFAAGLDLEMPKAQFMTEEYILASMKLGTISEADIDDKVRRILNACLSMKIYENQMLPLSVADWDAHQRVALQTAQEGIVLLKNECGLLPLDAKRMSRIALLGPNARLTPTSGGGAAYVEPCRQISILEGIERYLGAAGRLVYVPGTPQQYCLAALDPESAATVGKCDAAIVCIGFNEKVEGEGHDRPFELPAQQVELIRSVRNANPRTIVVVTSGGGIAMESWLDQAPAVIQSWYLGQVSGEALASIVFGAINPSGKLPISIERRWRDSAAFGSYEVEKSKPGMPLLFTLHGKPHDLIPVPYREGIFVGYRHFDHKKNDPLFPFGYGLSYTTFRFDSLTVKRLSGFNYRVDVTVTNTGGRPGSEVVQLYIRDNACSVPRPLKELKGFAKVILEPGESKKITIQLNRESFAFYSLQDRSWRIESGEFLIQVGNSSRDIRLQQLISIENSTNFK